ncbi:Glutamate receptor 1, partial [Stegodyphus mimosarum]
MPWDKLKQNLSSEYGSKINSAQLHNLLQKRHLKPSKSLSAYLIAMREIASRGSVDVSSILDYVINGIPDPKSNKIILYGYKTISEFKEKLKIYEKICIPDAKNKDYSSTNTQNKAHAIPSNSKQSRCYNCASIGHKSNSCNNKRLLKLQQIFHLTSEKNKLEMRVVRRISNSTDASDFLRKLEEQDRRGLKYVILDCEPEVAKSIVSQHIQDTYMNRRNYHFLITSLIIEDDWNDALLPHGAVNATGFQMLQETRPEVREFLTAWKSLDPFRWPGGGTQHITTEVALMYDATKVILETFNRLLKKKPDIFRNNFRRGEVYNNGTKVQTEKIGLTGNITFDDFGWRKNFTVNIVEMSMNSEMVKVAHWSDSDGLQLIPPNYRRIPQNTGFENKTYIVTSILARQNAHWIADQWRALLFMDESRFSVQIQSKRYLIWRKLGIHYHSSNICERDPYGGDNVCVWGSITLGGLTGFRVFPRVTMNTQVYRDDILDAYVLPYAGAIGDNFLLQEANARPYRARFEDAYFLQQTIPRVLWSVRSPNLCPIKHVWDALGRRRIVLRPPLQTLAMLPTALREQLLSLPMELMDCIIGSIAHRCMCCIASVGNHTPY